MKKLPSPNPGVAKGLFKERERLGGGFVEYTLNSVTLAACTAKKQHPYSKSEREDLHAIANVPSSESIGVAT